VSSPGKSQAAPVALAVPATPLLLCADMTAQALDEAFERVKDLAATFKTNEARYLSAEYQEAEARKDFIDKFFIALGWDVNHDAQTNPYAQEVKVERIGGASQRRADYAFYLAPNFRDVRFYVEAKKPRGDIATPDNYFQTIRYGSGSRTPLAVLTDFEQFHILDSRFKADIQTALKRCVRRFHYSDYSDPERFAEIYWLFSREALTGGFLEKFAATLPRRGKDIPPPHLQSIDDAFLDELEQYRETLAHAFKNRNPRLDSETLTEATQRTLDRLVFMRFLEDKLIEPTNLVAGIAEAESAWPAFIAASRRLDNIYNGIVFKQHGVLDAPSFRVDNDAFAYICQRLSDEHSPYNFDAIPIHILGSIYERFLGKVIVATDKRATVKEKPAVRKAGGVYYTPEYIVRYIVESTVGKLIADKTPDQIATHPAVPEAPCTTSEEVQPDDGKNERAQTETPPLAKPKGHGRIAADEYHPDETISIQHASLKSGDACPMECDGKLYRINEKPGGIIRIKGQVCAHVVRYEFEKLRCALCGAVFKADPPPNFPPKKYDEHFRANLVIQKYFMA